ncbi:MAG: hypothetical protein WAU88_15735 [Candidatus Zixiibacteriota bacterium]
MKNRATLLLAGLTLIVLGVLAGCSENKQSDPRETVISLFGAMEKNDQATIARMLDLPELMKNTREDYAVSTDDPRVFTNPKDILDDLTNEGLTKRRWFSMQRIIGNSSVDAETATVEVTFVDKQISKGYLTKFGLHKTNGKWRIYSFKTFEAAKQE